MDELKKNNSLDCSLIIYGSIVDNFNENIKHKI